MFFSKHPFFRHDDFLLHLSGQITVFLLLFIVRFLRGSLPESPALLGILIGLLLFSLLLWCMPRRNPLMSHLYLGLQFLFTSLMLAQDFTFMLLFLILTVQAMIRIEVPFNLLWVGAFVAAILVANYYWHPDDLLPPTARALIAAVGFLGATAVSYNVARIRRARKEIKELLTQVSDAHTRLQEHTSQAESLAAAEARNRLSTELHDALGHRLTVSIVQLEGAARLIERDPHKGIDQIQSARAQLVAGLNELRNTLNAVRVPRSDDNNPEGEH